MNRRPWRASALLLSMSLIGCASIEAHSADDPTPAPQTAGAVPGELLIKLKPESGQLLEAAVARGARPTRTGLAWFDALNTRHGVTRIEAVFQAVDLEAIKQKYPTRARRAPPDTPAPDVRYVYKLTLRRDADVRQAAADYAARPDVVYAQPNYLAAIQSSPRPR